MNELDVIYHHLKGKRSGAVEALQAVCRRRLQLQDLEEEIKGQINAIDAAIKRIFEEREAKRCVMKTTASASIPPATQSDLGDRCGG